MAHYKYFEEHTADIAFEAVGSTLEEMFEQAAIAVQNVQVDIKQIGAGECREIALEADDMEKLLFDFLSELLFYKDSELLIFSKFDLKVSEGTMNKVSGKCCGEVLNDKHDQKVDVKAITLHMFKVEKTTEGWKCFVIVDI